MRLPWAFGAVISVSRALSLKWSKRSSWLHSESLSAHLVMLRLGSYRLVRFRPSQDHARRLGLPIMQTLK
jgi:hypothetical protein